MATGISTNISSQLNDKRYDDSDRGVFSIHGNELLRHALYLIWLLLCCKQTIPRRYYHGAPRPLRHPDNDIVTSDFCRYLRTWQGHKHWILRKAESVVPQESRRAMLTKDIVETVITACHDRKSELGFGEMIVGFRTMAVTVDDSKASKVELIPAVKNLKERVAALEKAEGELKGQVKDLVKANKELEE
ncbi:hypothetical protein BDD12DRAFT_893071 [Trichophaea hybrida]|nr:hypothetical protein BDD12DRAFT_893071 [Trichophaea hybrida]